MAKKNTDTNGFVYSTDKEWFNSLSFPEENTSEPIRPHKQKIKIFTDRLKGNKIAIRLVGFIGTDEDLENLAKELKQACGVGGTARNGEIILQGDCKTRVGEFLTKKDWSWKTV